MSEPVVFAAPADVELSADPIRPQWIIEGTPQARSKRLAPSADDTSMIMASSCTAGRFEWHYAVDETVHLGTMPGVASNKINELMAAKGRVGTSVVRQQLVGSHESQFIGDLVLPA